MTSEKIPIKVTRGTDFKVIYAGGIFGGLNPMEGRMTFYIDRMIPKIVDNVQQEMKTEYVERELQAEVHMSPQQFISIFNWMKHHINRLTKQGIFVEEKKPIEIKKAKVPK